MHQKISILLSLLLLISTLLLAKEAAEFTASSHFDSVIEKTLFTATRPSTSSEASNQFTIVLDPGHGGNDPGKIAADGTLEKDINLAIVFKLKQYLEASDIQVVMTRTTDDGLYDPGASNKKAQDMKARVALIEESKADLTVSIHQNSYSDSRIHGAQIFYYSGSPASKRLAENLQNILVSDLDPDNHRKAKANDDYYMLKKTTCPTVIVECGFMSHPAEAALLKSEDYQDQIAWVLHMGIVQYLNNCSQAKSAA